MESSYWLRSQKTKNRGCLPSSSKKKKIMKSTAGGSLDNNPFESLPTEILQKILGYLPVYDRVRVERVCRRWKNVSTERVWRDVQVLYIMEPELKTKHHRFRESLGKFDKFITMENNELFIGADELGIIDSLVSRVRQYVKKVIFVLDSEETPIKPSLSIIATHCRNIESIELNHVEESAVRVFAEFLILNEQIRSIKCGEADNIIGILSVLMKDWISLQLGYGYEIKQEYWEEKLIATIENSPSVEELYLDVLTLNMLPTISKCEQLKAFYFPIIVEEGIYDQINPSLLNRLTRLIVRNTMYEPNTMFDFLRKFINLQSLDFCYTYGNLPREVVQAVLGLPNLESLTLHARSITDKILIRLLKFKCLEIHSYSHYITENAIFEVIMKSECLEKLGICEMKVTSQLFKRLAQSAGERRKVLKIEVSTAIYKVALDICKGSKIHIIERRPEF